MGGGGAFDFLDNGGGAFFCKPSFSLLPEKQDLTTWTKLYHTQAQQIKLAMILIYQIYKHLH